MSQNSFPVVSVTMDGQIVREGAVTLEVLEPQLELIREAFTGLFTAGVARAGGELRRLEVGLAVTGSGDLAFTTGNLRPSVTLLFEKGYRAATAKSKTTARRAPASKKTPEKTPLVIAVEDLNEAAR
jgi:hypothetical protein